MIEQAVCKLLGADSAVAAIVGGGIHYAERPQTYAIPAIVIQRGDAISTHHLKGRAGRTSGIVRVTCLTSSYLGAADLARAVNNKLDGFVGTVDLKDENGDVISLRVKYLLNDGQDDVPSDHRDGQGSILTHGIQIDYRFANTDPR